MKIIYNSSGFVDLENPIYMEEDQLQKFRSFLKSLLHEEVEIKEVKEKERFIHPDGEKQSKRWNEQDLILLLDPSFKESDLIKKLERSAMSINMQRAQFVPEFVSWAKSKGFDADKITTTIIKQFLEAKHDSS